MERSVQRRMSRDLSRQVNAEKRIGIEMMESQVQIGGKVMLQADGPQNGQIRFIEVRVRIEIELASTGDRIDVEISGALLVHGEVLQMNVRFQRRLFGSAAGSHREVGDAVHCEPTGLKARETGEVEVASGKIQAKLALRPIVIRRSDDGAPGQWSIVSTGVDVVELKLATCEAEIAFQHGNSHSVGHAIANLNVSIAVRIETCARDAGRHIESAGKRLVNSGQLNQLRHVSVAKVEVQGKWFALQKHAACELSTGVKAGGSVAMNERAIMSCEMTIGELDGGGERVPVDRSGGDSFGCGQNSLKVIDFEISTDGKGRESAAGAAGQARPAVNRKGQISRSITGFEQWCPFLQVVASEREAQR